MSGWNIFIGGESIGTYDHHDMDRIYEAVVEGRRLKQSVNITCDTDEQIHIDTVNRRGFLASCDHSKVTHTVRSISYGN
jgi:hypothetical protein